MALHRSSHRPLSISHHPSPIVLRVRQSAQAAIQAATTEAKCNLPNGIGVVKVRYCTALLCYVIFFLAPCTAQYLNVALK